MDITPRPFKGAVLCLSGVSDKHELYKKAEALGAAHVAAFTDKVTHLVTPEHGSQKYYCAVERNVPIMLPAWVDQAHDIWKRGDDVDFEESIATHRLPPFAGVVISIAGMQDVVRRGQIIRQIREAGGEFVAQIERPVTVTHLLCASDDPDLQHDEAKAADIASNPKKLRKQEEGRELRRVAERFNERGEAKIMMVWEDWFWDSLRRGGRFEETKYDIRQPRPEKLQTELPPPTSSPAPDDHPPAPFRLRSSTNKTQPPPFEDDEEQIPASVKQTPKVKNMLWGSLLKGRGWSVDGKGELQRSPSRVKPLPDMDHDLVNNMEDEKPFDNVMGDNDNDDADENPFANDTFEGRGNHTTYEKPAWGKNAGQRGSVLAGLKRAESFVASTPIGEVPVAGKRALGRVATASDIFGGRRGGGGPAARLEEPAARPEDTARASAVASTSRLPAPGAGVPHQTSSAPNQPPSELGASPPKILLGMNLCLRGEADCAGVRDAVIEHGGRVVEHGGEEEVDFVVVRLVSGSTLFLEELSELERAKYRTESWLERCMFDERICAPDEKVGFVPIGVGCPITGAGKVKLSYSGLDESESLLVRRMGRALGIEVLIDFSKRTTHLLCPSALGPKCAKALEWGIPVVGMSWLADMAGTGRVVEAVPHCVVTPASVRRGRRTFDTMDVTGADPMPPPRAPPPPVLAKRTGWKGKEKAVEEYPRIQDITNGPGHREPSVVPSSQPFHDSMDINMEEEGFEPSGALSFQVEKPSEEMEGGHGQGSPSHFSPTVDERPPRGECDRLPRQDPEHPAYAHPRAMGPNRTKSDSEALRKGKTIQPSLNQSLSLSFASFGRDDGIRAQSSFPKNKRVPQPGEDDDTEEEEEAGAGESSFILKSFHLEEEMGSDAAQVELGLGGGIEEVEAVPSSSAPVSPMGGPRGQGDGSSPPGSPSHRHGSPSHRHESPSRQRGSPPPPRQDPLVPPRKLDGVKLKESIASLLGKRPADDDGDNEKKRERGPGAEERERGGKRPGAEERGGKRPRPKVTSARTLQLEALRATTPATRSATPSAFFDSDASIDAGAHGQQPDYDGFSLEEFEPGLLPRQEHDLTIRYDLTEQIEERLKLEELLKKDSGVKKKVKGAGSSSKVKGAGSAANLKTRGKGESRAPGF